MDKSKNSVELANYSHSSQVNNTNGDLNHPETCRFIAEHLARRIIDAQICISRAFRKRRLRLFAKNWKYLVDLYFNTSGNGEKEVYVVGEFSQNPWSEPIKMKYSLVHRCHTVRLPISNWWQFKFMVNDRFYCSEFHEKIATQDSFVNNIFLVKERPRTSLLNAPRQDNGKKLEPDVICKNIINQECSGLVTGTTLATKPTKAVKNPLLNLRKLSTCGTPQGSQPLTSKVKHAPRRSQRIAHPLSIAYSAKVIPELWSTRTKIKSGALKAPKLSVEYDPNLRKIQSSKPKMGRKNLLKKSKNSQSFLQRPVRLEDSDKLLGLGPENNWMILESTTTRKLMKPEIAGMPENRKTLGQRNYSYATLTPNEWFKLALR